MNDTDTKITELLATWCRLLNDGTPSEVSALYHESSSLLPTFSPHAIRNAEGRLRYFTMLAGRPGFHASIHDKTLHIEPLPERRAVASGIYRFAFEIDGESLTFEARFTMVCALDGEAPILHHHSSQLPRALG